MYTVLHVWSARLHRVLRVKNKHSVKDVTQSKLLASTRARRKILQASTTKRISQNSSIGFNRFRYDKYEKLSFKTAKTIMKCIWLLGTYVRTKITILWVISSICSLISNWLFISDLLTFVALISILLDIVSMFTCNDLNQLNYELCTAQYILESLIINDLINFTVLTGKIAYKLWNVNTIMLHSFILNHVTICKQASHQLPLLVRLFTSSNSFLINHR